MSEFSRSGNVLRTAVFGIGATVGSLALASCSSTESGNFQFGVTCPGNTELWVADVHVRDQFAYDDPNTVTVECIDSEVEAPDDILPLGDSAETTDGMTHILKLEYTDQPGDERTYTEVNIGDGEAVISLYGADDVNTAIEAVPAGE